MEKRIFELTFQEYLQKYLKLIMFLGIGLVFLLFISDFTCSINSIKTYKLMRLLNFIKYVFFIYISYLISKKMFKDYDVYKYMIFGQGVIIGIACGVVTSVLLSIHNFIIVLFRGDPENAIFEFFNFIIEYTFITESLLFIILISLLTSIFWIHDNYKTQNNK